MAILVVGGQTKDVGKTSVVAGIIAALPEMRWAAIKITQSEEAVCVGEGEGCECVTAAHSVAVREERVAGGGTDSSRYLAAGAVRAFWVRVRVGHMAEAMSWIGRVLARAESVVIESNSIVGFLRPDVYLSVLDPRVPDFKESARMYLDRADAVLMALGALGLPEWGETSARLAEGTRVFTMEPPEYCPPELVEFLRKHLPG